MTPDQQRLRDATDIPTVSVMGIVDRLGYLYCTQCRDFTDYDEGYVWSDQTAHVNEPCDDCGRIVSTVPFQPRRENR